MWLALSILVMTAARRFEQVDGGEASQVHRVAPRALAASVGDAGRP
jgi:hypothetical protein